ncbi:MAG: hypothetical protein AAFQ42_04095 [Pseudomonadota bacterium]
MVGPASAALAAGDFSAAMIAPEAHPPTNPIAEIAASTRSDHLHQIHVPALDAAHEAKCCLGKVPTPPDLPGECTSGGHGDCILADQRQPTTMGATWRMPAFMEPDAPVARRTLRPPRLG